MFLFTTDTPFYAFSGFFKDGTIFTVALNSNAGLVGYLVFHLSYNNSLFYMFYCFITLFFMVIIDETWDKLFFRSTPELDETGHDLLQIPLKKKLFVAAITSPDLDEIFQTFTML